MRTHHYPSDVTDAQWNLIEPHIPPEPGGGRPRKTEMRDVLDEEHSITVGSIGDPRGHRKCLPLKKVPASRLVIRTQQQYGFRTLLVPVEARPLQPQVHHTADRTLDRATANRHLQRRDPCVIHPTLTRVPLEVITLPS